MTLEITDVGTSSCGRFLSFDFYAEGDTVEEMVKNSHFSAVDQDGGEVYTIDGVDHMDEEDLRDLITSNL